MSDRITSLCEKEYEHSFYRWLYTPKWRLVTRLRRRLEWKLWLKAMCAEIRKDATQ